MYFLTVSFILLRLPEKECIVQVHPILKNERHPDKSSVKSNFEHSLNEGKVRFFTPIVMRFRQLKKAHPKT